MAWAAVLLSSLATANGHQLASGLTAVEVDSFGHVEGPSLADRASGAGSGNAWPAVLLRTEANDAGSKAQGSKLWMNPLAADFVIATSGAFLLPAQRAGAAGLNFLSLMFAMQAVVCGSFHYCEHHRVGSSLDGPSCSEPGFRLVQAVYYIQTYFVFLQVMFLHAGPEDPSLQSTSQPTQALLTRFFPYMILTAVIVHNPLSEFAVGSMLFHVLAAGVSCVVFVVAASLFWLVCPGAARRMLTSKPVLMRGFILIASVFLGYCMVLGVQSLASKAQASLATQKVIVHCTWHVTSALAAAAQIELCTGYFALAKEASRSHGEEDLHS